MQRRQFSAVLTRAVKDGLVAAALVDRTGNTMGLAGAIVEDEARPLAAVVMHRLKSEDLASRLFEGEIVSLRLDDRDVAVGVARRFLFVVAVLGVSTPETIALVRQLRDDVAEMLSISHAIERIRMPPPASSGGGGGSGSGPAELPLIELGVTVRRERGKA